MDFRLLFPSCLPHDGEFLACSATTTPGEYPLVLPGLEFHKKEWFAMLVSAVQKWEQNVLFLGQGSMGKDFFLKKLLAHVRPERFM